jgi:hypothetical protein
VFVLFVTVVCYSFDLILDASGGKTTDYATGLLRPYTGATYVKLTIPIMNNVNAHGLALGLAKSGFQYSYDAIQVKHDTVLLKGSNEYS